LKVEDRLERHRQSLEQPPADYRMWLAEQGGEVIGFACTGKSGDADADERTAELYAIYLTPDRIGTGVGRELLDHAVADLTDRGFRTATLWVLRTNEVAHRFYEGTGWATDGTTSAERVDREMRPTVRYRRDLA
jgi:GNAT superfamily N-acetyltransferase